MKLQKVSIQVCRKCKQHEWCTRHVEGRYAELQARLQSKLQSYSSTLRVEVQKQHRVGAFEVKFNKSCIYSKLSSGKFPSVDSVVQKIKHAQQSYSCKNVRLMPSASQLPRSRPKVSFQSLPRERKSVNRFISSKDFKNRQQFLQRATKDLRKLVNMRKKVEVKKLEAIDLYQFIEHQLVENNLQMKFSDIKLREKPSKTMIQLSHNGQEVTFQDSEAKEATFKVLDTKEVIKIKALEQGMFRMQEIGQAEIRVQDCLTASALNRVVDIFKNGVKSGQLALSTFFQRKRLGKLEVLVKDAEIFIDTEVIGKMDPFVRLKLGSQQFKTTTKDEAGAHPVFQEIFTFYLENGQADQKLVFELLDEDLMAHDELGACQVAVQQLLRREGETVVLDCRIKDAVTSRLWISTHYTEYKQN